MLWWDIKIDRSVKKKIYTFKWYQFASGSVWSLLANLAKRACNSDCHGLKINKCQIFTPSLILKAVHVLLVTMTKTKTTMIKITTTMMIIVTKMTARIIYDTNKIWCWCWWWHDDNDDDDDDKDDKDIAKWGQHQWKSWWHYDDTNENDDAGDSDDHGDPSHKLLHFFTLVFCSEDVTHLSPLNLFRLLFLGMVLVHDANIWSYGILN